MNFEWDEHKNHANIRKHGFDLGDACEVFDNPVLDELDTRKYYGEERWLGNRIVVVTYTQRGEDTIRIISLRKALKHERKKFEQAISD